MPPDTRNANPTRYDRSRCLKGKCEEDNTEGDKPVHQKGQTTGPYVSSSVAKTVEHPPPRPGEREWKGKGDATGSKARVVW